VVARSVAAVTTASTLTGPDLAAGHVDDAGEADGVGGVLHDPEVGEQVLDLAPLPEPDAADEAIRDAPAAEDVLERPRLGVDAVQDGEVSVAAALTRRSRSISSATYSASSTSL